MSEDTTRIFEELSACAREVRENADPIAGLARIGAAMNALIGSTMFTFLRIDLAKFEMDRVYSTRTDRYPMGAKKAMRRGRWSECLIERGEPFIAAGVDDMRATFGDAGLLAELGIDSTMSLPVRLGGRTLATMNLNGRQGQYGPRQTSIAAPFATLALPLIQALRS